jgi:hypothetical protein
LPLDAEVPPRTRPLDEDSTLGEWLENPTGSQLLLQHKTTASDPLLENLYLDELFRAMPLKRLSAIPGPVILPKDYREILAEVRS